MLHPTAGALRTNLNDRNAEGAVRLIYACLPALNVLISQARKGNSYYLEQESRDSSRLQLRKIQGSKSDHRPTINRNVEDGTAFSSDERVLISNANASYSVHDFSDHILFDGVIMRSVAVSQSIKVKGT